MDTNRIEKKILLRAPKERIWRALSDSTEFGHWFGMKFDGPFSPGACVRGTVAPTTVDAEVASAQKKYEGLACGITIEQMDPGRLFSFRWHPNATDPTVDYSGEPTTLIVFELEETADGVMLTLTESGFDQIPLARRAKALTANERGWSMMVKLLEKYVGSTR
jgi:uncharacterized protein YndB with AHSA1/START domain